MASDLQEPQCSNCGVSVRLFLTSLLNAKKKKSIEFYDTAAAIFLSSNRDAKEEGREESQEQSEPVMGTDSPLWVGLWTPKS